MLLILNSGYFSQIAFLSSSRFYVVAFLVVAVVAVRGLTVAVWGSIDDCWTLTQLAKLLVDALSQAVQVPPRHLTLLFECCEAMLERGPCPECSRAGS